MHEWEQIDQGFAYCVRCPATTAWKVDECMREQIKLVGGHADGEVIEVFAGMAYVEVPFVERSQAVPCNPEDSKPELNISSEVYTRTSRTAEGFPIYETE